MHSCLVRSSDGCAPSSSASERHVWHPGRLGGLAEGGPGGHDVLALRGQVDQPKCVCSGTRRAKLQRSSMWTMSHVVANVTCRERRSANITSLRAVSFGRQRAHGRGSKNVRFMVDYVAQWRASAKLSRMSVWMERKCRRNSGAHRRTMAERKGCDQTCDAGQHG